MHGFASSEKTWQHASQEIKEATKRAGHKNQEHILWNYPTKRINWWGRGVADRSIDASLTTLGDALWSRLVSSYAADSHARIVLVGHSFGGLVISACMTARLSRPAQSDSESLILKALCSPIFVASPLVGANMARLALRLHRTIGSNIHLRHLAKKAPARVRVERDLVNAIRWGQVSPSIFGAQNDRDVKICELIPHGLSKDDFATYHIIDGNHSKCLTKISENAADLLALAIHSAPNVNPFPTIPTFSSLPSHPIQSSMSTGRSSDLWTPNSRTRTDG